MGAPIDFLTAEAFREKASTLRSQGRLGTVGGGGNGGGGDPNGGPCGDGSDPKEGGWASCEDNVIEVASEAFDPDLTGIGSTPWSGDQASTGVRVPVAPTTDPGNRYLFRLCGVEIPSGYAIMMRLLRQLVTIRQTDILNGEPRIIEREVESPFWRFQDGNVSWHLRLQKQQFAPKTFDPAQVAGTSPEMRALDASLLYRPPLVPYLALGAGQPPGTSVGAFGTFRDIRFPWQNQSHSLSVLVKGPGAVVFYASVFQPDPDIRPLYPSVAGMRPEDQFLGNFPRAIYGRVAGAMVFQIREVKK